MSDREQQNVRPGQPGAENEPTGGSPEMGAFRRSTPGAPEPGTNQGKPEPVGEGNVSPGTGSYGADHGGSGVGTGQPDRAGRPVGPANGTSDAAPTDERDSLGTAYRQPQRYGASPDPIGNDDAAGASGATPGGPPGTARPADPVTGDDAGATAGLGMAAMPGTSETAAPATGVRRAVFEGAPDNPAASDVPVEKVEVPVADRRTDVSGPGSAAATRGEVPQPPVEQTQSGKHEAAKTHQRPVTGVRRPQAPNGEVAPD